MEAKSSFYEDQEKVVQVDATKEEAIQKFMEAEEIAIVAGQQAPEVPEELESEKPKEQEPKKDGKGHYFSWKMQKEFYYRSERQREYMEFFDEHEDVSVWEAEPFSLEYEWEGKKKKYIPTFYMESKGGQKFVFELGGKDKYMKSEELQTKYDEAARVVTERGGQFRFVH